MKFLIQVVIRNSLRILVIFFTISCVAACGQSSDFHDIEQHIQDLKKKSPSPILPLPSFKTVETYAYSAESFRSPFAGSSPQRGNAPSVNRPKGPLEVFPLDALRMVGILREGPKLWAIITAPNGVIYNITVGNYIGQNYGRVTAITPKQIELIELMQEGDSWVQKPASLALTEQE